jgi:type II secretory pathway pseudopilin PulG
MFQVQHLQAFQLTKLDLYINKMNNLKLIIKERFYNTIHYSLFTIHSKRGQTLLELVVLIGVIIIVVTGMVSTMVYGLKNSQFSQNQLQATKLAQEGLELMRSARQNHCKVTVTGVDYYWNPQVGQFSIWNQSFLDGTSQSFVVNLGATPSCTVTPGTDTTVPVPFIRTIKMKDLNSQIPPNRDQIQVTSTVIWIDPTGSHSSTLSTILANIDI